MLTKVCPIVSIWAFLFLAPTGWTEIKSNRLFSDGAVLQQGVDIPVWGTAGEGVKVTVTLDGKTSAAVARNGKWMVRLPSHKAGGPFILTIEGENTVTINNVLIGEVWVCAGQSNMAFALSGADTAATEIPTANYPWLRMFTVTGKPAVEPMVESSGSWAECNPSTVKQFSAVGYFFGRDIHKATGMPVGMIHASMSGSPGQAWMSFEGLVQEPELVRYVNDIQKIRVDYPDAMARFPQEMKDYDESLKKWNEEIGTTYNVAFKAWFEENKKARAAGQSSLPQPVPARPKPVKPREPVGSSGAPTVLYNGKIAPLLPYAIKGVIWYQGESNSGKEYRALFPRLISDWREKWGQGEFPFLFVQIAPCGDWKPEIREAQLLTWQKVPHTAMVVTTDVGDATNIHPTHKEPVGTRLAMAARAMVYGEKIEYSGPVYDALKIEENRAIVGFKHIGSGLVARDGELKGFTIAGQDNKFIPARAEIKGDTVIVSSDLVATPVAVRYGWANVPEVNLFNQEGLPASPFRSDVE